MCSGYRVLLPVVLAAALALSPLWVMGASAAQPPTQVRGAVRPSYVFSDNSTLFVVFKFGAWTRLAYNGSQAVAPLAIYFYSRSGIPVEIHDNYNNSARGTWGLLLNVSKVSTSKPYELWVKYRGREYHFVFKVVRALKEEKKKGKMITLSVREFREWLDREAQAATFVALFAVGVAVWLKRRLLLIGLFNTVNVLVVFGGALLVYVVATRLGHSAWLSAPWALGYLLAYKVYPVGRKLKLLMIDVPSRTVTAETAVVYATGRGLAIAKQSLGEAIRRWFGKHIYVVDAEVRKLGVLPSEKIWRYNDADTLESMDAVLVLDSELKKARVRRTMEGWVLSERDND